MNANALWDATHNLTDQTKWDIIQERVVGLVALSAWSQLPNAILSTDEKMTWDNYIGALQDLAVTYPNPQDVVFPDPPGTPINQSTQEFREARARRISAPQEMSTVGNGWPTYTRQQALDWVQTNIGTPLVDGRAQVPLAPLFTFAITRLSILKILDILDKMLVLQIAMLKMIIALRNKNF